MATIQGWMAGYVLYLARLGEARLLAGRTEDVYELAMPAVDAARKYKERGHEAWALYLLGELAARGDSPDFAAAAAHYGETMAAARSLGMRSLIAQCHGKLAGLYRLASQRDQARDHLITATTMFRETDMRFWLERTQPASGIG